MRPLVDGAVPKGASILIVKRPWIDLILDGHKIHEIRGRVCKKPRGELIYLALSGGGGVILGSVRFSACHGPLSRAAWTESSDKHRVAGKSLPYGSRTYAWVLDQPQRFEVPVRYVHKRGAVVWALKD